MPKDSPDYELVKSANERAIMSPAPASGPSLGVWIALGVFALLAGLAAYIVLGRPPSEPAPVSRETARAIPTQAPPRPLGAEAAPIDLPPLDKTDALVRELVRKVSAHPQVGAWLATDDLIRRFTVAVLNVAEGRTPANRLQVLRPPGPFRVAERGGDLIVDAASYRRYDALAAAAVSIDAAGSARLYTMLKPRIEDAYRELGGEGSTFDRVFERAIVLLLQTPVPAGGETLEIEPRGIGYGYADPRLEGLSAAEKQLLRMGPRNVRIVQASLRQLALALGIPAERLPAPQ
jgi:hypothetical protein